MSEICRELSTACKRVKCYAAANRFPHAFLIEGTDQSECEALTLMIAKTAVCKNDSAPCGICPECLKAEHGSHPDIEEITPLKDKKNITVSQIREIISKAFIIPHSGKRKVFIIKDAHKMNEQAQNALLKILEEPPKYVVFVLTSVSRTLLLETVLSRCILLTLSFIENKEQSDKADSLAKQYLEFFKIGKEYEMLLVLKSFEKDRALADEFFLRLRVNAVQELKSNLSSPVYSEMLSKLCGKIPKWQELLKTNVNLALLSCAASSMEDYK